MESRLRKGQSYPDGTYEYSCGCGFQDQECPYCYGGDLKRCQAAIKTNRGQIYYGLLKTILSRVGKAIVDDFKQCTFVDVAYLSLQHGLNFKATAEWLEETGCMRTGLYEFFKSSGHKVGDAYAAAHEKYAGDLREKSEDKR
jgi:hypothetical protein